MIIQSLFIHLHTDETSGEVLYSTTHFWSFTAKQHCSILLNKWSGWGGPKHPILIWKDCYLHPSLSPQSSKALAFTASRLSAPAWPHVENVNNAAFHLICDLMASRDLNCTVQALLSYFIFLAAVFLRYITSPRLLQLLRRMLKRCFGAKLQKSLVDYKTSPDFSSAWGWIENTYVF